MAPEKLHFGDVVLGVHPTETTSVDKRYVVRGYTCRAKKGGGWVQEIRIMNDYAVPEWVNLEDFIQIFV